MFDLSGAPQGGKIHFEVLELYSGRSSTPQAPQLLPIHLKTSQKVSVFAILTWRGQLFSKQSPHHLRQVVNQEVMHSMIPGTQHQLFFHLLAATGIYLRERRLYQGSL